MVARAGMAGLVVIFLTGCWLVAAPFALRFQSPGAAWTGATRMDVGIGAGLVAVGFAGFFVTLAGRVRELYAQAAVRDDPATTQTP
jgi:hypothetical protein